MTECPDYHLRFTLPPTLAFAVAPGRHQPCIAGCILTIARDEVDVSGTSREVVFEQARRFLRVIAKDHPPLAIDATLITPVPTHVLRTGGGGRDSWTIIVRAEIAFSPTRLPPDLGLPEPQQETKGRRPSGLGKGAFTPV